MTPRYEHDCTVCRFLGTTSYIDPWSGMEIDADLYFCADAEPRMHMGGTCLARISSEPSAYASAPLSIAETYSPPFSTLGRAVYIAALAVISEYRKDNPS